MTTIVKPKTELVVPSSLQRRAGIKIGDRLRFRVSPRMIVITAVSEPTYKPTKAESAAIRKGEAAIARGEYVSLTEFLHETVEERFRKAMALARFADEMRRAGHEARSPRNSWAGRARIVGDIVSTDTANLWEIARQK